MSQVDLLPARFPEDLPQVVEIFREYIASVSVDLGFQDYEVEFAGLPGKYAAPDGGLWLAWSGGAVVGCVALRRLDDRMCEMKRLYVRPAGRGQQVGRRLIEQVLQSAREAGYTRICLDVLPEFAAAQRLYASFGFTDAPAQVFNPVPGTRFLARDLAYP